MPKPKSETTLAMDALLKALDPFLKQHGFRRRGRTYNAVSEDGLVLMIGFQVGDCLREGKFCVNLGVHIPEAASASPHVSPGWIQANNCDLLERLGTLATGKEVWWPAQGDATLAATILELFTTVGLPWFQSYRTRERILTTLDGQSRAKGMSSAPRVVCAILWATRGEKERARACLEAQIAEAALPAHVDYCRSLAHRLGLDPPT